MKFGQFSKVHSESKRHVFRFFFTLEIKMFLLKCPNVTVLRHQFINIGLEFNPLDKFTVAAAAAAVIIFQAFIRHTYISGIRGQNSAAK